ncbi:MAG: hypothetical protein WC900_03160 [Oscillospiraceae bacterium]|jgi:hypothetical protein
MANILIRDVDPFLITLLDQLVLKEKHQSRNQLLQEIIRLYVTSKHEFFSKSLVPTIQFLSKEAISEHQDAVASSLEAVTNININVLKKLDKLYALFEYEINQHDKVL